MLVTVARLAVDRTTNTPVVFLREAVGDRGVAIWVGGAEASAAEIGVPFLGRLPLSRTVREASDAGSPPAAGDGPEAELFAELARKVLAAVETARV